MPNKPTGPYTEKKELSSPAALMMLFQLQTLIAATDQLLAVPVWNLSRDLIRKAIILFYTCILSCDLLCWSLSINTVQSASYPLRFHLTLWCTNVLLLSSPVFWFVPSAAKDLFIFICVVISIGI